MLFFSFLSKHQALFHCWKDKFDLRILRRALTSENVHLHTFSLWRPGSSRNDGDVRVIYILFSFFRGGPVHCSFRSSADAECCTVAAVGAAERLVSCWLFGW
jgi:hypothetical protein